MLSKQLAARILGLIDRFRVLTREARRESMAVPPWGM
jgi:hypothetical protein